MINEDVLDQDSNDQVDETTDNLDEELDDVSSDDSAGEDDTSKAFTTEPKAPEKRPVFSMPVAKAQEEKRKAVERAREEAKQEAKAELDRIRQEYEDRLRSVGSDPTDLELEKVAKEHGLEPGAAKALLGVFKKSVNLPDMTKYDKIVQDQELTRHKAVVSHDFDEKVVPLLTKDFPQATPEHIREVKQRIEELAFSEGYNTYRIEDIYRVNKDQFEFKNSMSAESSGGRGADLAEFKVLSDEDEIKLSDRDPETYVRYLKWLEGKESKYLNID